MRRRWLAPLALAVLPSCLAHERWPKVEPPYEPSSIEGGRPVYVRMNAGPPYTIENPFWEESDGREFIAGTLREEPDCVLDVPRFFLKEYVFLQDSTTRLAGRVPIDEIAVLRVHPPNEKAPNCTTSGFAFLIVLVIVVIAVV